MQVPEPEYVEFTYNGKSVKFATKNLGATSIADGTSCYGDYYAWGATETFGTVSYTAYNAGPVTVTKDGGYTEANAPADFADVVTAKMGAGYRMPTSDDFKTLYDACGGTGEYNTPASISDGAAYTKGLYWVTGATSPVTIGSDTYSVNGVLFVQDSTHHVFFPATGYVKGTYLYDAGTTGTYCSSSLYTGSTSYASNLNFHYHAVRPGNKDFRYFGFPVRPVFMN